MNNKLQFRLFIGSAYFKVLLMLLSFILIFWQVNSTEVRSGLSNFRQHAEHSQAFGPIYIVLLLMPVNWLIESVKWKLLTNDFYPQSFMLCARGVLSGIAISFFTPNRSGDFAGRILHLPASERINGAVHSLAGSIAQLLITLTAGIVALVIVFEKIFEINELFSSFIYIVLPLALIAFHVLFFRIPMFGNYLSHIKLNYKWIEKVSAIKNISRILLLKVYALSMLRYFVFTLQFWILLQSFGDMYSGWLPLALIMISFLFISVIPSFALSEIGIRGSVCIFLFSAVGYNGTDALVISVAIWMINVVLPAIAGAVSMLYFKLSN